VLRDDAADLRDGEASVSRETAEFTSRLLSQLDRSGRHLSSFDGAIRCDWNYDSPRRVLLSIRDASYYLYWHDRKGKESEPYDATRLPGIETMRAWVRWSNDPSAARP
jgi:hypothetical protein